MRLRHVLPLTPHCVRQMSRSCVATRTAERPCGTWGQGGSTGRQECRAARGQRKWRREEEGQLKGVAWAMSGANNGPVGQLGRSAWGAKAWRTVSASSTSWIPILKVDAGPCGCGACVVRTTVGRGMRVRAVEAPAQV
eukprot:516243-Prymnesium_polylepis.1